MAMNETLHEVLDATNMSSEVQHTLRVDRLVWKVVPPLLLIAGFILNCLSYAVVSRFETKTSSTFLIKLLAVMDNVVLLIHMPDLWFWNVFDIDFMKTLFFCKLLSFLLPLVKFYAYWIIVLITIFRVINCYSPNKAYIHCSQKRAYFAVSITLLVLAIVLVHHLITTQIDEHDGCQWIMNTFTTSLYVALFSIIPFGVIIIGNCYVIYRLNKFHARTNSAEMSMGNPERYNDRSMNLILIAISIVFLVTTSPHLISNIIEVNLDYSKLSKEYQASFRLWETIALLLTYVNNVINFGCYCLASQKFRKEFANVYNRIPTEDTPLTVAAVTGESDPGGDMY